MVFTTLDHHHWMFFRVQPLVSMVFRWFSKFWGQWSTMVLRLTMVWMYHWTKCLKSIYDKIQILSRKSIVHIIWTIPVDSFHHFTVWNSTPESTVSKTNRLKVKILSDFGSLHKHFPHGKHRSESEIIDHYFRSQNVKQKSDLNEWLLYNSVMRQVWSATAMRGNKYQGQPTIDFTSKEPNQDCIVTTG